MTHHLAIDLAANLGDNIYAADGGVIVYAGWNSYGYGNMIMVDHGDGFQTLYAHLSQISWAAVKLSPRVKSLLRPAQQVMPAARTCTLRSVRLPPSLILGTYCLRPLLLHGPLRSCDEGVHLAQENYLGYNLTHSGRVAEPG